MEAEDRFIAGCVVTNQKLYKDERPAGVLRISNERYYQFVIARSLMSGFSYRVDLERATHDIVLYRSSEARTEGYAAVGEIKCWMWDRTTPLELIRRDIKKLNQYQCPTFLLIIRATQPEKTVENLKRLVDKLSLEITRMTKPYTFQTSGWHGTLAEAALVGFLLPQSSGSGFES